MTKFLFSLYLTCFLGIFVFAQDSKPLKINELTKPNADQPKSDEKAEAVLKKAVEKLGGEKYLQVKSTVGRGRFSILSDGAIVSFQSFVDVIVHPDKERTEFMTATRKLLICRTKIK